MSDTGIKITRITSMDNGLNIVNSNREVHADTGQVLWTPELDVVDNHTLSFVTNHRRSSVTVHGSLRPVSGELEDFMIVYLVLDVAATSPWIGHTVTVQGSVPVLGFLTCGTNVFTLNVGANSAKVYTRRFIYKPIAPWGIAGDFTWTIKAHEDPSPTMLQDAPIGTTRLEMYGLTSQLPPFFNNRVDVRFLRYLLLRDDQYWVEYAKDADWAKFVTNSAFNSFKFEYDLDLGSTKYAATEYGGPFQLTRWLQGINQSNKINCYDQGSIVQIALGLCPGLTVEWMYMQPFGFIRQTNLVGYLEKPGGNCNNPVGATEGTMLIRQNNSEERHPFGNHVFIRVGGESGTILDACAGPHVGKESLQNYIDSAIQRKDEVTLSLPTGETTLYDLQATKSRRRPGIIEDVSPHIGVTCLDGCYIRGSEHDLAPTESSIGAMAKAKNGMTPDNTIYSINLTSLKALFESHADQYFSSLLNEQGVVLTWDLHEEDPQLEDTEIRVAILASNSRAQKFFENDLHTSQIPKDEYLIKATSIPLQSQLFLATKDSTNNEKTQRGALLWVRGNVCVSIIGNNIAQRLWSEWGSRIDSWVKQCTLLPPGTFRDFAYNIPRTAPVDSNINVKIKPSFPVKEHAMVYDVWQSQTPLQADLICVRFATEEVKAGDEILYTIRTSQNAGIRKVQFAVLDNETGQVYSVQEFIKVY